MQSKKTKSKTVNILPNKITDEMVDVDFNIQLGFDLMKAILKVSKSTGTPLIELIDKALREKFIVKPKTKTKKKA